MRLLMSSVLALCLYCLPLFSQSTKWQTVRNTESDWLFGADFVSAKTGWAVGESGTIFKTTNAGFSWFAQNSGTIESFTSVDFIDSLKGWAVGNVYGTIWATTNGGSSWARQDSGFTLYSVSFPSATNGWAVGDNGVIRHTTNGGTTWNQYVISGVSSLLSSIFFLNATTGWIGGSFPAIMLSTTDGGTTWNDQSSTLDPGEDIEDVYFIDQQKGWLAGYNVPHSTGVGVIQHTTDGGATWSNQTSGTGEFLTAVAFVNASQGWVTGTSGLILETTNAGSTWNTDSSGTTDELDDIVVRAGAGGWIVGGKILMSFSGPLPVQLASFNATVVDGSNVEMTWTTVSEVNNYGFFVQNRGVDDLSYTDVPGSFVGGNGTTLDPQHYAFTQMNVPPGEYLYRLKQIDLDGLEHYSSAVAVTVQSLTGVADNRPYIFSLDQNFPNPFNPSTLISYQLPARERVVLKVYDVFGREVATLQDGYQDAGNRSVRFDGSAMPSGMYFYKITAGTNSLVKKMVLMK